MARGGGGGGGLCLLNEQWGRVEWVVMVPLLDSQLCTRGIYTQKISREASSYYSGNLIIYTPIYIYNKRVSLFHGMCDIAYISNKFPHVLFFLQSQHSWHPIFSPPPPPPPPPPPMNPCVIYSQEKGRGGKTCLTLGLPPSTMFVSLQLSYMCLYMCVFSHTLFYSFLSFFLFSESLVNFIHLMFAFPCPETNFGHE